MKEISINRLHRYVGIIIAPFLVIQAISGLLLGFGLFRGGGTQRFFAKRGAWDEFLVKIHFGPGVISDAYHLLLGIGIICMAVSGWILYVRIRRSGKKINAPATKP